MCVCKLWPISRTSTGGMLAVGPARPRAAWTGKDGPTTERQEATCLMVECPQSCFFLKCQIWIQSILDRLSKSVWWVGTYLLMLGYPYRQGRIKILWGGGAPDWPYPLGFNPHFLKGWSRIPNIDAHNGLLVNNNNVILQLLNMMSDRGRNLNWLPVSSVEATPFI